MNLLKQHLVSITVLCATLAGSVAVGVQAHAEAAAGNSLDWLSDRYPYLVVDQALPDVLRELGYNVGVPIEVSSAIKGRILRYEHEASAGAFLDYLVAEHRLDWVMHDGRLFVTSIDEQVSRSWSGDAAAFDAAAAALVKAGIGDQRYPIGFDAGQGKLSLAAPPQHVALAAPVIERVLTPKAARSVNVIHGRSRAGGT